MRAVCKVATVGYLKFKLLSDNIQYAESQRFSWLGVIEVYFSFQHMNIAEK